MDCYSAPMPYTFFSLLLSLFSFLSRSLRGRSSPLSVSKYCAVPKSR